MLLGCCYVLLYKFTIPTSKKTFIKLTYLTFLFYRNLIWCDGWHLEKCLAGRWHLSKPQHEFILQHEIQNSISGYREKKKESKIALREKDAQSAYENNF